MYIINMIVTLQLMLFQLAFKREKIAKNCNLASVNNLFSKNVCNRMEREKISFLNLSNALWAVGFYNFKTFFFSSFIQHNIVTSK